MMKQALMSFESGFFVLDTKKHLNLTLNKLCEPVQQRFISFLTSDWIKRGLYLLSDCDDVLTLFHMSSSSGRCVHIRSCSLMSNRLFLHSRVRGRWGRSCSWFSVSPSCVSLLCYQILVSAAWEKLGPAPSSSDCQSGLFADRPFLSFILPFIRSLLSRFPRHALPVWGKLVIANVIKKKPLCWRP